MSRWFRHYAGMMRDDKLVRVAITSQQPIERVLWVWGAILESAAELDAEGRFDFDEAEVAYFLRAAPEDIAAIIKGLTKAGRIARKFVKNWNNRQFKSDRSNERVARYREREKSENQRVAKERGNVTETPKKRRRNSPETETEEEIIPPPTPPQNGGAGESSSASSSEQVELKPEHVLEAWNDLAERTGLNRVDKLTNGRLRKVEALIRSNSIDEIGKALDAIETTPFLRSGDGGNWSGASFDWLINETNFAKITEGAYGQPAH